MDIKKPIVKIIERKQERFSLKGRSALLIDSGLGLLSVARAIHQTYPEIKLFALSDHEGFPWGPRKNNDLITRCLNLVEKGLKETQAEAVVIACNTATTVALEELRDHFDVPIVGVIPGVKPAAHMTKTGNIGVLATEGTIERMALDELISEFAADCKVVKVGSHNLAAMAEDKLQGKLLDYDIIEQNLQAFKEQEVDVVTLGCTHYPLLLEELKIASEGKIHFLDSGFAVARQLARRLAEIRPKLSALEPCLYYTGDAYHLDKQRLKEFGLEDIKPLF
ncbi:MAG: glutamate racemase [Alphaproteobacteria bacterium]